MHTEHVEGSNPESPEEVYERIKKKSRNYRKNRRRLVSLIEIIEKVPHLNRYLNYETIAKRVGDMYLKRLAEDSRRFAVEDNIGVDTAFYGKTIRYKTPVSLASFESDLDILNTWSDMGANPTIKTAMPTYRKGNKKPRMKALKNAFINAMGLPGPSAEEIRQNLLESGLWKNKERRMTLSVGGESIGQYIEVFKTLYYENYFADNDAPGNLVSAPYCDFVDFEINVSCPNTGTGTAACDLSGEGTYENFEKLLSGIREITGDDSPPVYIKLSPDFDNKKILDLVGIIRKHRMGVVLGNTMSKKCDYLSAGKGGLSGKPLNKNMIRLVKLVHEKYGDVPIKACGGISSAYDVLVAIHAGADTVEMATAVFEDPYSAIAMTNLELSRFCEKNGYKSLDDFRKKGRAERIDAISRYVFNR